MKIKISYVHKDANNKFEKHVLPYSNLEFGNSLDILHFLFYKKESYRNTQWINVFIFLSVLKKLNILLHFQYNANNAPRILNHCSKWSWLVSFTLQLLYLRTRSDSHSQSGRGGCQLRLTDKRFTTKNDVTIY